MSKEQLVSTDPNELKKNVGESIAKTINDFLEKDSDVTVSQAQMEAFVRMVEAFPEGKFKEFVAQFESLQKTSSKLNELVYGVQDGTWKVIKPLIALSAPMVVAIPNDPFRKLAIKSSRLGGALGEKVIETAVKQTENIKKKIQKIKERKNQTIDDE